VCVRIRSAGSAGRLNFSSVGDAVAVDPEAGGDMLYPSGGDSNALEIDRSTRALGDEAERAKKEDGARFGLDLIEDDDVPAIERRPRFEDEGGRNKDRRNVIVD
jgi:hypothetical protein